MSGKDSVQVQRPVVAISAPTRKATSVKKSATTPVPVVKTSTAKTNTTTNTDNAIARVKKVYREQGFFAAVGAYFKEALCGPGENASKTEKEAYNTAMAICDYNTLRY